MIKVKDWHEQGSGKANEWNWKYFGTQVAGLRNCLCNGLPAKADIEQNTHGRYCP